VCLDENGYPQFNDLLFHRAEPCFFVFDVLSLEAYDLRNNALIERKDELRRLLGRLPAAKVAAAAFASNSLDELFPHRNIFEWSQFYFPNVDGCSSGTPALTGRLQARASRRTCSR
jgi:hypothetical protein